MPMTWKPRTNTRSADHPNPEADQATRMKEQGEEAGQLPDPQPDSPSDADIERAVAARLGDDRKLDATSVTVRVAGGIVVLEGTVLDETERQRAEDCALAQTGATGVENRILVAGPEKEGGRTL